MQNKSEYYKNARATIKLLRAKRNELIKLQGENCFAVNKLNEAIDFLNMGAAIEAYSGVTVNANCFNSGKRIVFDIISQEENSEFSTSYYFETFSCDVDMESIMVYRRDFDMEKSHLNEIKMCYKLF